MATCPSGHDSAVADYCDVCGMRMDAPAAQGRSAEAPAPHGDPLAAQVGLGAGDQAPASPGPPCPRCGTPREGQFCETCGFDFESPAPATARGSSPAPVGQTEAKPVQEVTHTSAEGAVGQPERDAQAWAAVGSADRVYYEALIAAGGADAAELPFPESCPDRRLLLTGARMRIGRRSASRGLQPEVDLTGPPTDPGISHLHAILISQPDGGWAVMDPGSANGTLVNGAEIPAGDLVQLGDGDRIHIGAWTSITVHKPERA